MSLMCNCLLVPISSFDDESVHLYQFHIRVRDTGIEPGAPVLANRVVFRLNNHAVAEGGFQHHFVVGDDGSLNFSGVARRFKAADGHMAGYLQDPTVVEAEVYYEIKGTKGQPLGTLIPKPNAGQAPSFSTDDAYHPDSGSGRFKYVITVEILDDANPPNVLGSAQCIGVKVFSGTDKKLCGNTITNLSGNYDSGKSYPCRFEWDGSSADDIDWIPVSASTPVNTCPD